MLLTSQVRRVDGEGRGLMVQSANQLETSLVDTWELRANATRHHGNPTYFKLPILYDVDCIKNTNLNIKAVRELSPDIKDQLLSHFYGFSVSECKFNFRHSVRLVTCVVFNRLNKSTAQARSNAAGTRRSSVRAFAMAFSSST